VQWKKKIYNEAWYPGDTLNVIIGQGRVLATPMQMAQVAVILANKGKRIKPKLVHAIHAAHTDTLTKQPLEEMQVINVQQEKNWDIVIDSMQKVVHIPGGTAYRISKGLNYQIAGKTGTAQVFNLKQNEKYEVNKIKAHLRDHSWFIAFAPVNDPQIAIAVIIENKHTKAAADIARVVLDGFLHSKSTSVTSDTTGEDESEVGGEEHGDEEHME
jgi:penicillin-binding protein 2